MYKFVKKSKVFANSTCLDSSVLNSIDKVLDKVIFSSDHVIKFKGLRVDTGFKNYMRTFQLGRWCYMNKN